MSNCKSAGSHSATLVHGVGAHGARVQSNACDPRCFNQRPRRRAHGSYRGCELLPSQDCEILDIVVVSHSNFFQSTAQNFSQIMQRVRVLHILKSITTPWLFICSDHTAEPPELCENLFSLFLDGVCRTGGEQVKKVIPDLLSLVHSPASPTTSTEWIFSALHTAAQNRGRLLSCFTSIKLIKQFQIDEKIKEDNMAIAVLLQTLLNASKFSQIRSDMDRIPREHSLAVLNLTHQVLNRGLPSDWKEFTGRAHLFLGSLSAALGLLPDDLLITGVVLPSGSYPVANGGCADIYRGKYSDPE
ncbi:hypothetical protein K438DRAFT_586014 [Mycena galopus ATCC 62051]|nr:hypothetical protein K438DRAFT_586014 [Mycena galopus ATCC 62051]